MTRFRLSLQEAQRLSNGVGDGPVEIEHFPSSPPNQLNATYLWSELIEFSTQVDRHSYSNFADVRRRRAFLASS